MCQRWGEIFRRWSWMPSTYCGSFGPGSGCVIFKSKRSDGLSIVEALFPLGSHFPLTSTEIAIKPRPCFYLCCGEILSRKLRPCVVLRDVFYYVIIQGYMFVCHGVPGPSTLVHNHLLSLYLYWRYIHLISNVKSIFLFFDIRKKEQVE